MGETVEDLVQMGLMIGLAGNREHTASDNQDTPDNHLAELSCESSSTSSLHSDHSELDESEDPNALPEDDIDAQSYNSGLDAVDDDTPCDLGDETEECTEQVVRVFCLLKMCQTEHSQDHGIHDTGNDLDAGQSSHLYGDSVSA
jgi:hypothetical protein